MSEQNALIVVDQLPVIQEQLRALRDSWEQRAADAASMICTEETVQSLKTLRADMRKEFAEADTQRKAAKAKYMAPWDAVEVVFKECVKDAFTRADASLKETISVFEDSLKESCKAELTAYFQELVQMEGIDFLTFEQAMSIGGLKISMADAKRATPRQLQDGLAGVVSRVACDLESIDGMNSDQGLAVLAEYKANGCNLNLAIKTVNQRIKAIEDAKQAAEQRRAEQERQREATERVAAAAPARPVQAPAAPAEQPSDPVYPEFSFTVYGARKSQLLKIRDFLRQEGIEYK